MRDRLAEIARNARKAAARCSLFIVLPLPLLAQLGDNMYLGDDREHSPNSEIVLPPSPVRSPEEEMRTFAVPAGFRVELVAAEPLVRDPVAMKFDSRGRLWVVELPRFNAEILTRIPALLEKGRPVPATPECRIVILEDTHGSGRMDRRTVFLDHLKAPRGIGFFGDGVLVGDPPHLWLCRQGPGGQVEKTLVAGDWGNPGKAMDVDANGLIWGRDNWLYDALYPWRLRSVAGRWIREPMPALGQWGITQDDYGRLFYDRNVDHLRGDLLPSNYGAKLGLKNFISAAHFEVSSDQAVWPIRPTLGVNRGYRSQTGLYAKDRLNTDGTLVDFTAASAPVIYRGVNFPARYAGNAFSPDPAGNLVKRNPLLEAEGRMTTLDGFDRTEFLASTDERFRPVFLDNGPDGALYVADLYRGILESYWVITSYLRDQILQRGLNHPLWGMGRIYRVVYGRGPRAALPDFAAASPAGLVALLSDPNGWTRDTAQRRIVDYGRRDCVPFLNRMLASGAERARIYALWCLEGLSVLTQANVAAALTDSSVQVRMAALRAGEPMLKGKEGGDLLRILGARVQTEDPIVLSQLSLSLIGVDSPLAGGLLWANLLRGPEHPFLIDATLLALRGREAGILDRLLEVARTREEPLFGGKVLLGKVAAAIVESAGPAKARLAAAIADPATPEWGRIALMEGMIGAPHGKMPLPLLERLATAAPDAFVRSQLRPLFENARRAAEQRARRQVVKPLNSEQTALFEAGRTTFLICSACHQATGEGREGLAPSLQGDRWAAAESPDFAIRIVLTGKSGTPGFPAPMVPFAASLNDTQIAAALTFVRRSWGNEASVVDPADVARIRAELARRSNPWTDAELEKIGGGGK